MMVKLYARDNEHLMQLLNGKIQSIKGVLSTETLIALEQSIKREIPIYVGENSAMAEEAEEQTKKKKK